MQQVATLNTGIAANGNNQNYSSSNNSNSNGEFAAIFEEKQQVQPLVTDKPAKRDVNSSQRSEKTDTTNELSDRSRSDVSASERSDAKVKEKDPNPTQSTTKPEGARAESNEGSSEDHQEQESSIEGAQSSGDESGSFRNDNQEGLSDNANGHGTASDQGVTALDLAESVEDPQQTDLLTLLDKLLINQSPEQEFDDGGPAADPFLVDVGQIVDEEDGVKIFGDTESNSNNAINISDLLNESNIEQLSAADSSSDIELTPEELTETLGGAELDIADLSDDALELNELAQLSAQDLEEVLLTDEQFSEYLANLLREQTRNQVNIEGVESIDENVIASSENKALLALLLNQQLTQGNRATERSSLEPTSDIKQILTSLEQLLKDNQGKVQVTENLISRLQNSGQEQNAAIQNFIASLKAGVAEFKEQLKAGREPGIDLQTLIVEGLNTADGAKADKLLDQQVRSALTQMQQVAQLSQTTEPSVRESFATQIQQTALNRENNAMTMEAAKQQQITMQFDKAVNIAKPEAAQQLAKHVQVMVSQKNMVAEIRLDPPDLGSMKINISMQGETASVNIVVQSQQARDLLEQNSPRLREMLEEQGIELGQSSVQEESEGQQSEARDGQFASSDSENTSDDLEVDEALVARHVNVANAYGVDYFA